MRASALWLLCIILGSTAGPAPSAHAQGGADPAALVAQAKAAEARGDLEGALEAIAAAGRLFDPQRAEHQANLAFLSNEASVLLRALGRTDEAMRAAEAAVAALPEGAPAKLRAIYANNLALAALDGADHSRAESALAGPLADVSAGALAPDLSAEVVLNGAVSALLSGKLEAALSRLSRLAGVPLSARHAVRAAHLTAEVCLEERRRDCTRAALHEADQHLKAPGIDADWTKEHALLSARLHIQDGAFEPATAMLEGIRAAGDGLSLHGASATYNLSEIAFLRGQLAEASALNDAAERAYRELLHERHPVVGQVLHRRALIMQELGDEASALELYEAAKDRFVSAGGERHPLWYASETERSQLLLRMGRTDEALQSLREMRSSPAFKASVTDYQALLAKAAYGLALADAGETEEGLNVLIAVREEHQREGYPAVQSFLWTIGLARLYLDSGDLAAASALSDELSALAERLRWDEIERLGEVRRLAIDIAVERGDTPSAQQLMEANLQGAERRIADLSRRSSYAAEFEPEALRRQVLQALRIAADDAPEFAFRAAQLVHLNEIAQATNGFAQQLKRQPDRVGQILRERQAVGERLRGLSRLAATADGYDAERFETINGLRQTLASLDAELNALAPEAADALTPKTATLSELQSVLGPDEALWLQATFEGETFLFLVSADALDVTRSELSAAALDEMVARLRATLDMEGKRSPAPFDEASAMALHKALFDPFRATLDRIERLILIPDGAAQQVALSVLMREGEPGDLDRYIGLSLALTVTPSVASFVEMRQLEAAQPGDGAFVGFGDPVLNGVRGGATVRSLEAAVDRGTRLARPDVLKSLFEPLPESADELRFMASNVGEENAALYLADEATEAIAKSLDYTSARTLVFATHAIVAGTFDHAVEPALIMTPPDTSSDVDDGILTASEIATMHLPVDLVILSACNTGAASERPGAAGLSGLARGFFDAGARSVVVSHWTIASISSVVLMPIFYQGVTKQGKDPSVALRDAMRGAAASERMPILAHPAIWAPFVVVGDR